MAALKAFLPLAVCLLMCHLTLAINNAPCQPSKSNNGFNTFVSRHIRTGTPNNLDQNAWEAFIKNIGGCSRPTQSFLSPSYLDGVKAVCTNKGGVIHKDNLCISRELFSFFTVRIDPGTCGIRSVQRETKYLILACEEIANQCLPVHFEGNPKSIRPDNNARGCQEPHTGDDAPSFKMTWVWLLSALLVIVYGYQR